MLIALVADFHGNRPATEALERDLRLTKPDQIWCLGDLVGKGPDNVFTYEWVFANCSVILGGNWDYGVGRKQFAPDTPYWEQLGAARLSKLSELPTEKVCWMNGRYVRFYHGRPTMKELIMGHHSEDIIETCFLDGKGGRYDVVIYADAHRQSLRTISPGLFINTGSVGNAMGIPVCCYALLAVETEKESAPFETRFRQVDYDRDQAVRNAESKPEIARIDTFIREIKTGIYSR